MWSLFVYVLGIVFCFGMFITMMKVGRDKVTRGALLVAIAGSLLPGFNIVLGIMMLVATLILFSGDGFFGKVVFDFREKG